MKARFAMCGFIVALLVVFAVVCGLSPLYSDDWDHVAWAVQHRHDSGWLASFLSSHYTFSSAMSYVLARSTLVHTIVTPLVVLALVWGVFVIAMRRRPRFDDWNDILGVVVIAALIWVGAPRAGLVFFHRPFTGTWLYGTTLAIWLLVPFRCGLTPRTPWLVALAVLGFVVGTSTRQLGVISTFAVLYAIIKQDRPRATWLVFLAVLAGTVVGYFHAAFDFRGFRPGVELSMLALNLSFFECGEIITLTGALVLLKLLVKALWPRRAGDPIPDTSETLRWFGMWFGATVLALFGPRYSEAAIFPAAIVVVIATFPYIRWAMSSAPLKIAMIAIAIAINLIAWSMALQRYVPLHAEFKDRLAKLAAAPRDSVATVTTYSQVRPSFWAYGEDWGEASRRQLIAAQVYRLRDILIVPAFRRFETNPGLEIVLEVDGVTPAQLQAADAPKTWGTTLRTARAQFSTLVGQLRGQVSAPFTARIVSTLSYDFLRGRKLLVASYENGALTTLKINRRNADDESRIPIRAWPRSFAAKYPEAYAVEGTKATPIQLARNQYLVQALTTELHAVVACDPARCFLVEAFIPAL